MVDPCASSIKAKSMHHLQKGLAFEKVTTLSYKGSSIAVPMWDESIGFVYSILIALFQWIT